MPFQRPNLADLRAQAAADIAAALPGADPLLPASNLGVLADVLAEGFNGEYGYLDYIARQAVPFTAVDEAFEGWAALKGASRKAAAKATGQGTWPGTPGSILLAGTQVNRGSVAYVTTADAVVGGGGTVTAAIEAVVAGTAGTLTAGASLVLATAVAGIGATGTATPVTAGVDLEAFDAYRTRVLAIYADPPQGGSVADYVEWALQVPGVTRAWCVPTGKGAGTVLVLFMMDTAQAAFGGFPQGVGGTAAAETRDASATGDPLTVADWIFPLQPVTALVYAQAPQANTVTFSISLPGASAVLKAAIVAAMDAVFLAYGEPGGTLNRLRLETAIATVAGSDGLVITALACDNGAISPTNGNIVSTAGFLPVRGDVTWA